MSPTHICKRDSICSTWVASAGADTSSDIFTCEQKEEQCTSVLSVVDEIQESPAETETANNEEERGQETARDPEVETSGEEECNLKCPHCFVSNSSCTSCIADPNLSPEEKKRCNPCKYASNDFCTRQFGLPQRFKWYAPFIRRPFPSAVSNTYFMLKIELVVTYKAENRFASISSQYLQL